MGSSTMPHKVNPTAVQHMKAKAMNLRYDAAKIADYSLVDHERDMQHFIGERETLENICRNAAELMDLGDELLSTLVVREEQMAANLRLLGGLTQSEHIMLEMGKKVGKQHAHEIVNEIAVGSFMNHLNFEEQLCQDERVNRVLGREEIHQLLVPMQYVGMCPELARREVRMLREKLEVTDSGYL